jgi:hypothetical protein
MQLPCQRDLLWGGGVLLGDRVDDGVERCAVIAAGDGAWVPGRENAADIFCDLANGGAEAHGDVVVDCHGGDVGHRHRGTQLLGSDVG